MRRSRPVGPWTYPSWGRSTRAAVAAAEHRPDRRGRRGESVLDMGAVDPARTDAAHRFAAHHRGHRVGVHRGDRTGLRTVYRRYLHGLPGAQFHTRRPGRRRAILAAAFAAINIKDFFWFRGVRSASRKPASPESTTGCAGSGFRAVAAGSGRLTVVPARARVLRRTGLHRRISRAVDHHRQQTGESPRWSSPFAGRVHAGIPTDELVHFAVAVTTMRMTKPKSTKAVCSNRSAACRC